MTSMYNPDEWAEAAARCTNTPTGRRNAFLCAVQAIKARAGWVLVNGKWVLRESVMRPTKTTQPRRVHMFKETGFKYVIFSISGQANPLRIGELYALFRMRGFPKPIRCVGWYNGSLETSWITTTKALDVVWNTVSGKAMLDDQTSFLMVSECNKQYAAMLYPRKGLSPKLVDMGSFHRVSEKEAKAADAWTYRCDTKQHFICKKDNPDRVPPPQGWPSAERKAQLRRFESALTHAEIMSRSEDVARDLREIREFLSEQYGM